MRSAIAMCAILLLGIQAFSQGRDIAPSPKEFTIGRRVFFDFGPPFDFYELFIVRSEGNGASIEKILLTPPGDVCFQPGTLETNSVSINDSVSTLLGPGNPCSLPEKDLRRELKRCKKCSVFSGAEVAMQVQCGTRTRIIRSEILDKDLFGENPRTPKHTSQTMQLLSRLDHAAGLSPFDKPMFQMQHGEKPAKEIDSVAIQDLSLGKYDSLFKNAPFKPSDLYLTTQTQPPVPSVQLLASTPILPTISPLPEYPRMARIAHIEGNVRARIEIGAGGIPTNVTFESGDPILRAAAKEALMQWVYSGDISNGQVQVTLNFKLNCASQSR